MATNTLLEQLRATRADYKVECEWMRFLLDAYSGGGGFGGKIRQPERGYLGWAAEVYSQWGNLESSVTGTTYLDRFDREDDEKFKRRKNVAHYTNYVGPISDLLVSYVIKHLPTREGIPEKIKEWQKDVDGKGTDWDDFLADIVNPRAALLGWTPVLIDSPPAPGEPITRAQAEELGIRPRAIALLAANLLDWSVDENGRFRWVKIRLDYSDREDPLKPAVEYEKYSIWFVNRVVKYSIRKEKDKEPTVEGPEEVAHSFGEVPVVIWRHKPSPEEPVRGISMVGDIAIANRRHFNLESELDEHIRSQVFGLLQVPVDDPTQPPKELIGGNKNALPIKHDSRQPYAWIAPPESIAETLEKRIETTVKEMYRMGRIEYSNQVGAAESGISRAYKFEQTNRRLGDFAKQLARSEERTFRIVSRPLGVGDAEAEQIAITPQTDFRVEDLAADIDNTLKALGLNLPSTAEKLLIERLLEKMLPNLPTEIAEIIKEELEQMRVSRAAGEAMSGELEGAEGEPEPEPEPVPAAA